MVATANTTVDLGLPATPTTSDPEIFKELLLIYNAIKILDQTTDDYTEQGTLVQQVEDALNNVATTTEVLKRLISKTKLETNTDFISSALESIKRTLKQLKIELESQPNIVSAFSELRKQYYKYTVPKFIISDTLSVKLKFSLGDPTLIPPIGVQTITKHSAYAPAGGVGTAAGGWDTAVNRDAAIAAIKANADAITEIQTFLTSFGFFR